MSTLLLAVVLMASSVCGQVPEISQPELRKWLASPQAAAKTVDCFIQFHPTCDERAKHITAMMPGLIKSNFQCHPECSEKSQQAITAIVNTLQINYPDEYKRLITHFMGKDSTQWQVPEASEEDLSEWLATPEAAAKTVGCFIQFHSECDVRAKNIIALMPALIQNNFQCYPECSESNQQAITALSTALQTNYPDEYKRLITHFKGQGSTQQQVPEASEEDLSKWLATPEAAAKTVGCFIQFHSECDVRAKNISGFKLAVCLLPNASGPANSSS